MATHPTQRHRPCRRFPQPATLALLAARQFTGTLDHQGLEIACSEEIAWRNGFINAEQFEKLAQPLAKNGYGQRTLRLLKAGPQA